MKELINHIGNSGSIILLLFSIILLYNKPTTLFFYCLGFLINSLLNIFLKLAIKQPRPSENERLFYLKLNNGYNIEFNKYGMPSGHAQSVLYSLVFIYFASNYNKKITLLYLLISLITCYQREEYMYHTIFQVFIGIIIGLLVGYLFYMLSKHKIKGIMKTKKDDDAP